MSGAEVIAIVSCISGLIQAYEAASRTIERIKQRRQAHRARPPSVLLEQSVEKGKREIEAVVADGRERFGPEFEAGDG